MLFLLITAVAALNLPNTQPLCADHFTACENDILGVCQILDGALGAMATQWDTETAQNLLLMGFIGTATDPVTGEAAVPMNYGPWMSMIECECFFTDGCDFDYAFATPLALAMCAQDDSCVTAFNNVESEVGSKTEWDDMSGYNLAFNLPVATQSDKEFCLILGSTLKQANAKAMFLGTSMFATVVEGADDVIEFCNKGMAGMVLGLTLGVGFGVLILTLGGSCAYCYWCQKKE
jgi:hypothetical protein